ncbi:MAG: LysR family transcriptional regulator, partial [Rhizobiales bacterium]|nr:LysR family transcriptional regulator [Hyphomicrobiales bacterium]
IEFALGSSLFKRTSTGMELTEEGREFLRSASEILQKMDEALRFTRKIGMKKGKISIAASYTVLGYFLPFHLDRLRRHYPGIEIQVHELRREQIEEGLIANRFDLAIVLTSNVLNSDLESETLFRSHRRLWVPNGHEFAKQKTVSFAEIAERPYIMLTIDEAAHTTMRYWGENGHAPNVSLRTSSVEAVRSTVANGAGITILSDMVYRPWSLEGKRILKIATQPEAPTMDIGLAWNKKKELSPIAETVLRYFRQSFIMPENQIFESY